MITILFFIVVFLIGLLPFLSYLLWIYLNRKRYTRERFAFFLSTCYLDAMILLFSYILSPNLLSTVVNYICVSLLHLPEFHLVEPNFSDKCLAFIIFSFFCHFTYRLYKNWNGGKSIKAAEILPEIHENIVEEGYNFIRFHKARVVNPTKKNEDTDINIKFDVMTVEPLVWHKQVAELLELKDSQYKIKDDSNWYKKENCYIANYGVNCQIVAILCSLQPLSDAKISDFIKFVKSQKNNANNIRFIWAIKEDVDFTTKKIDDIDIEVITEKKLLDNLIDFSDYKHYIIDRYEKEEIYSGNSLTINDVYVEPTCTTFDVERRKNNPIDSIEQYITNWLNDDSQHKQLALLGEYGQGKSVLSLRLAYLLLTGQIESKKIPIIIELRGRYVRQFRDTREILDLWAIKFGISPKALLKLHFAGRLLLIFEGFDELDLIGDEQIRKDHFRKLWEFSIPNSKIIITGRPNYFMSDTEMKTLLRLSQRQADGSKYCETINLCPFSRQQIFDAMRSNEPSIREEIINVYDHQPKESSFIDLVSRPSLLFLVGIIWKNEDLVQKISNINSAEVIRAFLNHSYKRQDEKEKINQKAIMNSDERAYFMQGIAIDIVKRHGYTNQISSNELKNTVEKLLQTFPDEITKQSGNADPQLIKNRLSPNLLLSTINSDIRTCGVLVKDLSIEDNFRFAHKSFLEVLVADFISDSYLMNRDSSSNLRSIKVMNLIKTLEIRPNDLYMYDENIFKFVVELMAANMEIKGEEDTKVRVNSIYHQMHLYPFSLRKLGWIVKLFGFSLLSEEKWKDIISIVPLIGMLYSTLFFFEEHSLSNSFLLFLGMMFFFILVIILANIILSYFFLYTNSSKRLRHYTLIKGFQLFYFIYFARLKKMSDLKIILFFLVCKNLRIETALQKIWPSQVYQLVEYLSSLYSQKLRPSFSDIIDINIKNTDSSLILPF